MKCEKCGINEANVTIKQNINGDKSIYHLCSKCANDENLININYSFNNMVSDMFTDFDNMIEDMFNTRTNILIGPSKNIEENYSKRHKLNSYSFKSDEKLDKKDVKDTSEDIKSLEIKLKQAVDKEDYENAAIIRDKIKLLKKKDK